MSSRGTPEYKAVRSNFHEICQSLGRMHDTLCPLANDLASDRVKIIPEGTRSAVTSTRGVAPYELSSQLLSAVHVAIEYSPKKFYLFAEKLKEHGHEGVSHKLLKDCGMYIIYIFMFNFMHVTVHLQYLSKIKFT